MTYPAGVQLSMLTFSNPITFLGNPADRIEVKIQSNASVVWAATGQPIDDFEEVLTPGERESTFLNAPFVDQDGFVDQSGKEYTKWAYTVTRTAYFGGISKTIEKNWQPLIGQDVLDFDSLPGGPITAPVAVPPVVVTSVAGQTGYISAASLVAAIDDFLPESVTPESVEANLPARLSASSLSADLAVKMDVTQRGATSGVAPLDSSAKVPDANLPARLQEAALNTTITGHVTAEVPPAVSAYIASDPSVINSAATAAQNTVGLIPAWKASTAYTAGQRVIAPNGDVVSAKVNFTSTTTYSATNWTASTQDGRIVTLESSVWAKVQLSTTADLNTILTPGIHALTSAASATNVPVAVGGMLEVIAIGTTPRIQRYTTNEAIPRTYLRQWNGTVFSAWYNVNWDKRGIATNTDMNTIQTAGWYNMGSSTGITNLPPQSGLYHVEVFTVGTTVIQRATSVSAVQLTFTRRLNSGTWGPWTAINWHQGLLISGADFDTLFTYGIFAIQYANHNGQPVPLVGVLEVLPASGGWIQRFTSYEFTLHVYHRRYYNGGWQAWVAEPTAADLAALEQRITDLDAGAGAGGYGTAIRKPITAMSLTETSKGSNEIMVAMSPDRTRGWNANGTALKETTDEGLTWTTVYTFPAGTAVETVLPLANGELLVFIYNGASSQRWGYLSEGYGKPDATWTTVITGRGPSIKFTQSWSVFTHENIVLANEYGPKAGFPWGNIEMVAEGDNARYTFMSLDYGKTWKTVFDLNEYIAGKGRSLNGQHPHGVAWDKYWDRIWYTFGDNNGGSGCNGILYSDDLGDTWKEADFFSGPNGLQSVGIMPMPKCVLFAGDTNPSGLHRINREEGKNRTGHYTKDLAYDAPEEMATHLCQGITRINRVGDDAPAFFGFSSELNPAPSFLIATYDGYTVTQVWKDNDIQPVGYGIRSVVGPTLRGQVIMSSNDQKVAGKWSEIKGKAPGY